MTPFQAWLVHRVWEDATTQACTLVCTAVVILSCCGVIWAGFVVKSNQLVYCGGILTGLCVLWMVLGAVLMCCTRRWREQSKARVLPQ